MRNHALMLVAVVLIAGCSDSGDDGAAKDVNGSSELDFTAESDVIVEDSGGGDDVVQDQSAPVPNSYSLKLKVEKGINVNCDESEQEPCFDGATCCVHEYNRDLTGLETKFAFGSTHIAPAISLAMEDTMPMPTFTVITLSFGIIVGSNDKPPSTPKSGDYEFGSFEPEIKVTIYNKVFSSKMDGSEGLFSITDWTADEGGTWAGTVKGTIIQAKEDMPGELRAEVEGSFDFVLPKPAGR
jgi:hypothetical protein